MSQLKILLIMTDYKIHPVLSMLWDSFAERYKPGQSQTNDESIIPSKDRLSYVQYLPAKPIKRGIKVWMHCDDDTAYLHQFEVYLGQQQNSLSLALDMMWWWSYVMIYQEKNHHVYHENLFTTV